MELVENLTDSIRERLKTQAIVRIPASLDEFLKIASERDLHLEYDTDEIIAMSLATLTHEQLVATLLRILGNHYFEEEDVFIYGSNIGIVIPDTRKYYNADLSVVRGKPRLQTKSKTNLLNPHLVVEVLSKSTFERDIFEKLPYYKTIEELQQVIFVSQENYWISTYTRTADPKSWINTDYFEPNEAVILDNLTVLLKEIYRKITFDSPTQSH